MRYTTVWQWTWTLLAAGGVGLAILEWSAIVTVVVMLLLGAVTGALLSLLTGELVLGRRVDGSGSHLLTYSVAVAAAGTGLIALVTVSPPLALLTVLLLALSSPPLVAPLVRRWTTQLHRPSSSAGPKSRPPSTPTGEPSTPVALPSKEQVVVTKLSDQELFCLWRHTFWELRDNSDVTDRLSVISLRQACLEELERRDPVGLSAWLDSGARASGGPERFWHRRRKDEDGS